MAKKNKYSWTHNGTQVTRRQFDTLQVDELEQAHKKSKREGNELIFDQKSKEVVVNLRTSCSNRQTTLHEQSKEIMSTPCGHWL